MVKERRKYPRARVQFNITVETPGGLWHGRTMNLSPVGIKVAPLRRPLLLPLGTAVQVRFPTRDRELPFSLAATAQREDPDGMAFGFGNLAGHEFKRLKSLVDSDLQKQWQELLEEIEDRHAPAAGDRSRAVDDAELARWQALLNRLGFDNLQLPSDSLLSGQWREFLKRLDAEGSGGEKVRKRQS